MAKVYDTATDLITFARSSSGTALRRVGYGENLVTNGTFDADISEWADFSSTSVWDDGKISVAYASAASGAYQSFSTEAGKIYEATAEVISSTGYNSNMVLRCGNGSTPDAGLVSSDAISQTGVVTVRFVATGVTSYVYLRNKFGHTTVWDNVSVKEVIFDRATDPLVLFNHPDDTPRIEYGSDGSLKGLLIEEQRTNLVTHSEDFTQWSALTQGTGSTPALTAGYASPDGGNNAYRLQLNAGGNTSNDYSLLRTTFTSPGDLSRSIWIKSNTGSDQTVALVATNPATKVIATTEWQRLSDGVATSGTGQMDISLGGAALTPATADILIYGAQAEAGSFATSYIPTSGSQQTRSADVASIPVTAFGYNEDAGTVVVEVDSIKAGVSQRLLSMYASTNAPGERTDLVNYASSNVSNYTVVGGVEQTNHIISTSGLTSFIVAAAIAPDDYSMCVNGGTVVAETDGTPTVPTVDTFRLGGGVSSPLNGHIKSLRYFPRRLTNTQLQELTA